MKAKKMVFLNRISVAVGSAMIASVSIFTPLQAAETAVFFRVVSPTTTVITAFSSDGILAWSNSAVGVTGCIQRATTLIGVSNWTDFAGQAMTGTAMAVRLFDPNPPSGMVLIPGGRNSGTDPSFGAYSLTVSSFYMDRYEVTKAKWDEVCNWATNHGYRFENNTRGEGPHGLGKAADHPVQSVSWYDAVKWCNARSEKEGWTAVYYTDAGLTQIYKTGQVVGVNVPYIKGTASGCRLPTEVQWQYAARGGASSKRFPWSDSDTIQHARANYYSSGVDSYDTSPTHGYHPTYFTNGTPYTSPVGAFAPNGYGLYDMTGNVWEWCFDWYPGSEGSYRVYRGGSWSYHAYDARVAYRSSAAPDAVYYYIGFRVALPAGP